MSTCDVCMNSLCGLYVRLGPLIRLTEESSALSAIDDVCFSHSEGNYSAYRSLNNFISSTVPMVPLFVTLEKNSKKQKNSDLLKALEFIRANDLT